jgi:hypothetical protein
MIDEPLTKTPQTVPRRRWLRWLPLPPLLLVAAAVGYYAYSAHAADRELAEVLAETDRLDPDWRLDELAARRKVIPDEVNAALCVLSARRLMPAGSWPPLVIPPGERGPVPNRMGEAISYLPPPLQLHESVAREIAAALAGVEPALVEARKLKALSDGRYPMPWAGNGAGSKFDGTQLNDIMNLLIYEATLLAHVGRSGDALATARAALVAARSVGDEPGVGPYGWRLGGQRQAILSIERTLAQGAAPPDELRAAQELLADEAAQPLLLTALRGTRAATQHSFDTGWLPDASRPGDGPLRRLRDVGAPIRARFMQAAVLRKATQGVEIAKRPVEEQASPIAEMKSAGPRDSNGDPAGHCVWLFTSRAEDYCRLQALLRCAIAGLALERYRHEKGHWPEALDGVAPAYLEAVPLDPFDGRPLRYKRLPDGVLVYSVTPNDQTNFGGVRWRSGGGRGTDLGFRLWDVDRRRQPPAEVLSQPRESDP